MLIIIMSPDLITKQLHARVHRTSPAGFPLSVSLISCSNAAYRNGVEQRPPVPSGKGSGSTGGSLRYYSGTRGEKWTVPAWADAQNQRSDAAVFIQTAAD
jgi:hypothetical protein